MVILGITLVSRDFGVKHAIEPCNQQVISVAVLFITHVVFRDVIDH